MTRHAFRIRSGKPDDAPELERLYRAAFPEEDLVPLLEAMRAAKARPIMLIAERDLAIMGHIALTPCRAGASIVALLGPLAIHPDHQRQGLGTALIREGLSRLQSKGIDVVLVLGDPAYYHRHGFAQEAGITPPYTLPEEWRSAWQSLSLSGARPVGQLEVPDYWRDPALWGP